LNEIRKFSVKAMTGGGLDIVPKESFHDDVEFHRRDLNVAPFLSPVGLGFAAYGGVFTPKTQLSYSRPVYLVPGAPPFVDSTFEQKMNVYSSAVLLMYSETLQAMYTTFFGGISPYTWNAWEQRFQGNPRIGTKTDPVYLDGLQWTDQISTIEKRGAETTEAVQLQTLPAFLGTGSVFIPSDEIQRARPGTDILALDSLSKSKTFVGYIYGGIRAFPYQFPYLKTSPAYNSGAVPTIASDMILKVYISTAAK
jgi:hypothetical protein